MKRHDRRTGMPCGLGVVAAAFFLASGCETPSAHTTSQNYSLREGVPIDPPPTIQEDCQAGGRLFQLYCGSCHNARPLSERPFSNYNVAVAHMRDQAYLTGKEYRQIILFLRRWHDVGPATPPVEPSPKRMTFSQPIPELRDDASATGATTPAAAPAPPPATAEAPFQQPGAAAGAPAQPPR
jgi:hypothetical protein